MNSQNYSEIIRAYRTERAWTQEQLAEISGVGVRTIQRTETGKNCSFETLLSLAAAFDIDVKDIMKKAKQKGESPQEDIGGAFLSRVHSSEELFRIAQGAHTFDYCYDSLYQSHEKEVVGQLLDYLKEFGDMMHEIEPSMRMKVCDECQIFLDNLEAVGLWVFASKIKQLAVLGDKEVDWFLFSLTILRSDNQIIINRGSGSEAVYFPYSKIVRIGGIETISTAK